MAKREVENGGSSYLNITLLIENVNQQTRKCRIRGDQPELNIAAFELGNFANF